MSAYYNEFDPYAAQWLRNLIAAGHLPAGDVDDRSITEVSPDDLRPYTQAHFFAGIGGWPLALRLAGWPDKKPVWTGSCPCQPLSSAGQRKGHADERHLWPAFHNLISECGPPVVFGEQVASADGREWFSAVRADLEAVGYACGAADLCAAGVGAPHIRQRLWWVADSLHPGRAERWPGTGDGQVTGRSRVDGMADASSLGRVGRRAGQAGDKPKAIKRLERLCDAGRLADANDARLEGRREPECERGVERAAGPSGLAGGLANAASLGRKVALQHSGGGGSARGVGQANVAGGDGFPDRSSPPDGYWRDADWLCCRDGKWRPVESGTFPLAYGVSGRVGRLRAYGNAIVPQVAAQFVTAFMGCNP